MSFLPCEDEQVSLLSSSGSVISKSDAHDQGDSLKDLCSPFCICACCNMMAVVKEGSTSLNVPFKQGRTNPDSYSEGIIHANYSIWQPPKFS
ncbi:hypothetical protein SAMN04488522_1021220 [Pedobacter caeni]|uniref:Uncharacterized protein n=2 Tax=Pedobacter caeni TaxID=288992 RepID=A0A1M5BJ34_9SPHI|nr:hypothetical protein SAMN04488522_1021220 [Pedobacter caeni]